jgi:uncharacterized membrane-anchored protein YhcB (DUF1043 family)
MSTEDQLWDMSDEDLETAFKEASAQEQSPETEVENNSTNEEITDSETSTEDADEEIEVTSNEDENKEVIDGQDQPENTEESDHNASDETDPEKVTDAETDTDAKENPDGDAKADETENSEDAEEGNDEEQPARSYSFRANGKDYEFSSDEIVDQFPKIFGQAMDYTKKMQTIKPWRKTIDALEGAKLSHGDVSLMIDVLKGDKDAITEVLKRTGTDTLELNTEEDSNYEAKDYGRNESALAISDIVNEISKDAEYATTQSILSSEWDDKSWETISGKPEMIKLLHTDVKSGMYKTLQPIAEKLKVYDGGNKSDLDYYKEAAEQHFSKTEQQDTYNQQQAYKKGQQEAATASEKLKADADSEKLRVDNAKAQNDKRNATKSASAKRKAAAPTKSVSTDRPVVDYLDESSEDFDEWYKKLQDSV